MGHQGLKLQQLVSEFHRLIGKRLREFAVDSGSLTGLPDIAALTRSHGCKAWLPIPGMYGGFSYELVDEDPASPKLRVRSWSRVVAGSEQTHEVTTEGYVLIEDQDD